MDMRRAGERDEIGRTNDLNEPHIVPAPLLPFIHCPESVSTARA